MTTIRPELSKRNKYWISKYRYYELKYFCLQYPTWKKAYAGIDSMSKRSYNLESIKMSGCSDPTEKCAEIKLQFAIKMELVEQAATDADSYLSSYILKAVTEGVSYAYLQTQMNIPCSRDTYYDRYRKFFYLLDKIRN